MNPYSTSTAGTASAGALAVTGPGIIQYVLIGAALIFFGYTLYRIGKRS